jgi:acetolactate synthase I/II/III large subunit
VWWGHAEKALRTLAESLRVPVLMNGMARGTVPADHELAFSRARSKALGEADVALVIGVPMDFRLGFGGVFGAETKLIVADRVEPDRPHPRDVAAGLYGDPTTRIGSASCARSRAPRGLPSRPNSTTTAPRCTRCGCTPNSSRCWTATRSS